MKEVYSIQDVCLITGLTDRTLRSHLALGNLRGEKVGGAWQFTPGQVEDFIKLPQVRPGIQAKKNAIVYDFLLAKAKSGHEMCVILDLPGENGAAVSDYFCKAMCAQTAPESELRFAFEDRGGCPRVILRGPANLVSAWINAYPQK